MWNGLKTALNKLSEIKSEHFSEEETAEYKERLVLKIGKTITETGCLFPSRNYKNRYYIKVKPYIISFKANPPFNTNAKIKVINGKINSAQNFLHYHLHYLKSLINNIHIHHSKKSLLICDW